MSQNAIKKSISPEEIDLYLKEMLSSYLNGEVTEAHLARMLKKHLHGNSSRLSFRVVDLLPQFTQLLEILDDSEQNVDKKRTIESIKKLTNNLSKELSE